MPKPENLKPFSKGEDPRRNLEGRPQGAKNRSTIARKVLEMSALIPEEMFEKLKSNFPDIQQKMTTEEIATIVLIGSAIAKGDFNSYKAVMDSAYGAPKQEIENHNTNVQVLTNDPLSDAASDHSAA